MINDEQLQLHCAHLDLSIAAFLSASAELLLVGASAASCICMAAIGFSMAMLCLGSPSNGEARCCLAYTHAQRCVHLLSGERHDGRLCGCFSRCGCARDCAAWPGRDRHAAAGARKQLPDKRLDTTIMAAVVAGCYSAKLLAHAC